MGKNQLSLSDEQQREWDKQSEIAAAAITKLCEIFETNKMDEILNYHFSESLDEYNLKFYAITTSAALDDVF